MDGTESSIVPYLFLVTFLLALAAGFWQYRRARKAKRENHTSADARVHGDEPAPIGAADTSNKDRTRQR